MSKPIIAVDRDDVLALHYKALTAYAQEHFQLPPPEAFHSDFPKLFNINLEVADKLLWDFNKAGLHGTFELMPHAVEVLTELHEHYNFIIISTQIKQNFELVEAWILKHFPGLFDEIVFLHVWEGDPRTKAEICVDRGASFLTEDRFKNAKQAADAGVTALLFGGYEGKDQELPDNMVPVDDWLAVREYFASLV